jgi:hypothetical protein
VTKTNCRALKLFGSYYFSTNILFFTISGSENPRVGLHNMPKYAISAFTPSDSEETKGDQEKWLRYLDSASLNYP